MEILNLMKNRFEVKLVGGQYDFKLLKEKGIKGPILSMKVGYGYEVKLYKEKQLKILKVKPGYLLPQGHYMGLKDKLSQIHDEMKKANKILNIKKSKIDDGEQED